MVKILEVNMYYLIKLENCEENIVGKELWSYENFYC